MNILTLFFWTQLLLQEIITVSCHPKCSINWLIIDFESIQSQNGECCLM